MREIVFDTETTGFSFESGDRMVEIGCLEMVNRVETGRTFHAYFHPERAMPAAALLDAQLLSQVYVELTGGRQIGLGLVSETVEEVIDLTPTVVAQVRPPRVFSASEAELARHALFLTGITKPLWGAEASG